MTGHPLPSAELSGGTPCKAPHNNYLCSVAAGHEPDDHVAWTKNGKIAARWPVTSDPVPEQPQ